jgi:hypothetical protein
VIREDTFRFSRSPYAIDLDSVRIHPHREHSRRFTFSGLCEAVWFRRVREVTQVCWGTLDLWSHSVLHPVDMTSPQAILASIRDGRYGKYCAARWDGQGRIPPGLDGWWSFRDETVPDGRGPAGYLEEI